MATHSKAPFHLLGWSALTILTGGHVTADAPAPAEFSVAAKDPPRRKALQEVCAGIAEKLKALQGVSSLYFKDLDRGDVLSMRGDKVMHPASTIKTPVLVTNFRDIDAGKYTTDKEFTVVNQFPSAADGKPFTTDGFEESNAAVGKPMKLRRIMELMIHLSDNQATNNCTQVAGGFQKVTDTMRALGLKNTTCKRYITDERAFAKGIASTTTAADMGLLYEKIARNQAASEKSCQTIIEILLGQTFNNQIPAGVPKEVKVAHKTGWFEGTLHDGGILFAGDRKYVLVIMMTDMKTSKEDGLKLQADITRLIYDKLITPEKK